MANKFVRGGDKKKLGRKRCPCTAEGKEQWKAGREGAGKAAGKEKKRGRKGNKRTLRRSEAKWCQIFVSLLLPN